MLKFGHEKAPLSGNWNFIQSENNDNMNVNINIYNMNIYNNPSVISSRNMVPEPSCSLPLLTVRTLAFARHEPSAVTISSWWCWMGTKRALTRTQGARATPRKAPRTFCVTAWRAESALATACSRLANALVPPRISDFLLLSGFFVMFFC